MPTPPCTVLFLCTGNSARSILAEAILNRAGAGRFHAVSAGSQPKGAPHPLALELLAAHGYDTAFARSKSWDEFAGPHAPNIDIVITVCDAAAAETCPIWPGHPITAHWGIPDPAAVTGTETARRQAFALACDRLRRRIEAFVALPLASLDTETLGRELTRIATAPEPTG